MEHLHTCLACGNAPTIHFMEKFSAFVDTEVSPWFRPLDTLRRRIEPLVNPILDKLELWMMGACNTFHIGKFLDQAVHRTPMRAVWFWESAKKRGIHLYEFRLFGRPFDLYIATYKDRVIVFDGLPRPGTHSSASLDWMDDKAIIHKRFSATGIPVAMGGVARSKRQAIEIFTKTPHPVIQLNPLQAKNILEQKYGSTLRLGSYGCALKLGSKASKTYGSQFVEERHRHRYEFNNTYRQALED